MERTAWSAGDHLRAARRRCSRAICGGRARAGDLATRSARRAARCHRIAARRGRRSRIRARVPQTAPGGRRQRAARGWRAAFDEDQLGVLLGGQA
jgi:hypothetical protein